MSKHHICHFPCETLQESHLSMNTFTFMEWFSSENLTRSLKTERTSLFRLVIPMCPHRNLSKVMWRQKSLLVLV